MRSSTTVRRRLAGYAKRKNKDNKPKFPPARTKKPAPKNVGAAPSVRVTPPPPLKAPWMQTYGVPAVLLILIGLVVVFAGRIGDSISRPDIPMSNSPRYSSPQVATSESGSSVSEYASSRHPLPTDQSFLATHYHHTAAMTPAAAAPTTNGGTFHSNATGHCVVSSKNARDIAALVEGCLRRPN